MRLWLIKGREFNDIFKLEYYYTRPYVCKVEYVQLIDTEYGTTEAIPVHPEKLIRVCSRGILPHIFGTACAKGDVS